MTTQTGLLFIHAQTSLHPGTGTALGTVDMPIQRERHTEWPMIAGSSLKGVIRDHCRPDKNGASSEYKTWCDVFGSESKNNDNPQAGAISFTDARILAFPVRSARGVFAWVTCKEVLSRLSRDAKLAALETNWKLNTETNQKALVASDQLVINDGTSQKLLLEEYDFEVLPDDSQAKSVAEWIADRATSDSFTQERLKTHLVIIPSDEFTHFVKHATEVTARIGLDYKTKTVKNGGLFYEEFLPPETLMYSVVIANHSRRLTTDTNNGNANMTADEVFNFVSTRLSNNVTLQIGANETIGKGICSVQIK
jgi:CRISPR-associated protein Cmr4